MQRQCFLMGVWIAASLTAAAATTPPASLADSLWLSAYTTEADNYHTGLHFAWSADGTSWIPIGYDHAFVKSDYGNWGPQKRMLSPVLSHLDDDTWELRFKVGENDPHIGLCTSPDLIHWRPQIYPLASEVGELPDHAAPSVHRVPTSLVRALEDEVLRAEAAAARNAERAADDAKGRFSTLQPIATTFSIDGEKGHAISQKLMGIFFEDISYAADGGLYAELVQNRDFEYHPRDFRYRDPQWNATKAWSVTGTTLVIDSLRPIHANNPHYASLTVSSPNEATLRNDGFEGMPLKKDGVYLLNFRLRVKEGNAAILKAVPPIKVRLCGKDGSVVASCKITCPKYSDEWKTVKGTLKATHDCADAYLELVFGGTAVYHVDFVSLFPQDTYKKRTNGMRKDLAEALAALHPQFVRFPGGCVSHGDGLDNLYRWKNTIGPLESRVPNWNIWKYHQSMGLGFYEYFQFCEDLGAEPLPVIAAAVPCQNSCVGKGDNRYGQQGGIPLGPEMDQYIQDILDLIEWANGDPKTSTWAKKRADAGHPKPFNLKMIGIGNEDLISETFEERFRLIYDAIRTHYPTIEIIGTAGPFNEGSDYEEGWRFGRELYVDALDEHYYNTPGWFINNQHFYDGYARGTTRVYLGEYAAHIPSRANNIETALAEALHLVAVERNGDVVEMTSYAPLLARKGHTNWNPDLIYFDNQSVNLTTGYEVQRLFGQYSGAWWMPTTIDLSIPQPTERRARRVNAADVSKRVAVSVTHPANSNDLIIKVVNYLPVENAATFVLPASSQPYSVKAAEQLTGALDATEVKASAKSDFTLQDGSLTTTLAPYSLTVIRLQ